MASASSHRYQSRLFSFIHQQSRLLTNRLNRAFKSLQAVTSWIAPIVFYPSLPQETVKQNVHQLPNSPPTVDTPIQKVLLLVEAMPSPEPETKAPSRNLLGFLWNKFFPKANTKLVTTADSPRSLKVEDNNTPNCLIPTRPQVRGIASQISNRLLVLVSPQNEILDILNSQQQQVLQARIISEVTNWRLQRLLSSKQDRLADRQSWLLAPINLFSSIVSWTQRDKQQGKLRVFSDGAIASGAGQSAIASIDLTIAKFETNSLAPMASITKSFQIQGIIWAAIEYFFGDCTPRSAGRERTAKLPQPTINNLEDPWLEMSDLFGSEEVTKQSLILENHLTSKVAYLPEDKKLTQSSQELNKHSLRSLLNRWRQLTQKNSAFLAVKTPQTVKSLSKNQQQKLSSQISQNYYISQELNVAVTTNSPSLKSNSVAAKSSESLEHTPEWIETNATTMGYVKHPLEQLLEWLDLAMLWLENILIKFWHWLQQG